MTTALSVDEEGLLADHAVLVRSRHGHGSGVLLKAQSGSTVDYYALTALH